MRRFTLILLLYPMWLAMMAVHETGHCLNALFSGGRVESVTLPLLGFSRTDLSRNPHPLFVAWGGPVSGVLIPLAILLLARLMLRRLSRPAAVFAGFCLIANGAYIGLGPFMTAGDGHDLLRHGAPRWTLLVFGATAFSAGLYFWHRAGVGHATARTGS
jgi:hypothetical protein